MVRLFQSTTLLTLTIIGLLGCSGNSKQNSDVKKKKAEIYYNHGTTQLVRKDYTEALDNLLKANTIWPNDSKTLNNLGMAYFFKGQDNTAINYLKQAIDENPKNSDAKNNLASIYFKQKKYKLAQDQYFEITKDLVYRGQYRVYYNLALIEVKKGKNFQAIKYLNRSLKERYDYCPSHFKLGEISRDNGDLPKAYEWFQEASKGTCYNLPGPLYEQARTLIMMGKYGRAKLKLKNLKKRFEKSHYNALADIELKNISNKKSKESFAKKNSKLEVQDF